MVTRLAGSHVRLIEHPFGSYPVYRPGLVYLRVFFAMALIESTLWLGAALAGNMPSLGLSLGFGTVNR